MWRVEQLVVILRERRSNQGRGEAREVFLRNQFRQLHRPGWQAEASGGVEHLAIGVRKRFVPDQLGLA